MRHHRLLLPGLVLVALVAVGCGPVATLEAEAGPTREGSVATDPAPRDRPSRSPTQDPDIDRLIAYGATSDQVLDLSLPDGDGPFPVVVLIHGGFWREQYRRDLMAPLARDLVSRGVAAVNLEYGRVGGSGGWPETLADVADGLDHVAALGDPRLDLGRVAFVGHSAGGHLAGWAAARPDLAAGQVGADPRVVPCAVVSQAGVNDLTAAAGQGSGRGLGDGAVQALLGGGPDDVPDRYEVADPARHLPLSAPWLGVHGHLDDTVPVAQTEDFARAVRDSGGEAEVAIVEGDHFSVIDPGSEGWSRATAWLAARCDW